MRLSAIPSSPRLFPARQPIGRVGCAPSGNPRLSPHARVTGGRGLGMSNETPGHDRGLPGTAGNAESPVAARPGRTRDAAPAVSTQKAVDDVLAVGISAVLGHEGGNLRPLLERLRGGLRELFGWLPRGGDRASSAKTREDRRRAGREDSTAGDLCSGDCGLSRSFKFGFVSHVSHSRVSQLYQVLDSTNRSKHSTCRKSVFFSRSTPVRTRERGLGAIVQR